MASHYELHQTAQQQSSQKPFIDFYRQPENMVVQKEGNPRRNTNIQGGQSNQLNQNQQQQNTIQSSSKDFQSDGVQNPLHNFNNKQDFFDNQQDPSPISGPAHGQRFRTNAQSDNYPETTTSNFQTLENKKDEFRGNNQINNNINNQQNSNKQLIMVDRNVAHKRRSIENKEAVGLGNRPRELVSSVEFSTQNRQMMLNGAKSAMSNYGSTTGAQGQTIAPAHQQNSINMKQINKNTKVERDPIMEQQSYQGAKQRTLAKSQSQNKLMLVSQEALMNKNHNMGIMMYQDIYSQGEHGSSQNQNQQDAKNSFYKDQLNGTGGSNQIQDLLYKQHMQYSANGAMSAAQKGWLLKANNHNLLLSRMTTKTDCTFCNKTSAGGMISQSILPHCCSAIYCSKDQQGMMIQNNLSKKYSTNRDYYNLKIVNDLIYNENTHIVSIFKDYLILDDINEFLKRSYTQTETKVRLPKLCSFYEKYSQVFPNYVVLPESKYMFKNIQRKQKLIDEQYQLQEELAKKQHQTLLDEDKLFDTKFYNSYYSNMGADISMTKKQYEDQAKQISVYAGKKPTRIDQMKIDELVDRFLMKDSESNIQLLTSVALDFSGFTNSFINPTQQSMHKMQISEKTPSKSNQKLQNIQPLSTHTRATNQQNVNQLKQVSSIKPLTQTGSTGNLNSNNNNNGGKKSLESSKKMPSNTNLLTSTTNSQQVKKQKNSFNNNQQLSQQKGSTQQVPKLDTLKMQQNPMSNQQDSSKNTPRIQKANAIAAATNNVLNNQDFNSQKPVIQTSPGTKEAIDNYLHNCNLDGQDELLMRSNQKMQIDPQFQTQKLNVGPLLSPTSLNTNSNNIIMLESPQLKSPNGLNINKQQLHQTGSSSSLLANQQHFQHSLNSNQNRQAMKSQCIIPTMQQITSMKKTTRLSNGGGNGGVNINGNSSSTIGQTSINNNLNRQGVQARKNISPVPATTNTNQQMQGAGSRNQQVNTNSTQKSQKSATTHTKYLSGGADQYQKLLGLNPAQNINIQQNSYASNYDTLNSHLIQSSSKKVGGGHGLMQQQRSKQDIFNQDLGQGATIYSQASHQKQNPPAMIQQPDFNDQLDNEAVTGEDCDDFGIADERFASPDGNIVFQTIDQDNNNMNPNITQGRKSLDGTVGLTTATKQGQNQQMLLLTSCDDKLFSQSNNYDQIKKHLEQYITINPSTTHCNQGASLQSQHTMTFDAQSQPSNSKKYSATNLQSVEKYDEIKQSINSASIGSGSHTQGGNYQNSQEQSRNNATGQKPFESMKQKIRGVYDNGSSTTGNNNQNTEPQSIQSANKTPNKSSTHSKKSTYHQQNMMSNNNNNMVMQNNRMSIESNNLLMMATQNNANSVSSSGVPLSSTSANGRQLSFSQTSFTNNANNYRSITNLQQRKGSNINTKELSIESKRLSGQHRQSFKDLNQQQQQQQQVHTAITEQNKIIKRSATGKNLNIQDANAHSHTFGQFQSNFGSGNLNNPTFISHANSNNKYQSTTTHQQQNSVAQQLSQQQQQIQSAQAANTVRVMTPSYSLASLSKLISPTTTTSPMTMTVTVNGNSQTINRKQIVNNKGKQSALGVHPQNYHQHNPASSHTTNLTSSQSQNFLLSDKNSKLVTSSTISQKGIISSKANVKSSNNLRPNNTAASASQHPIQISNTISQKLGRHPISQQQNQLSLQQQSQSHHTFQQTPRGTQLQPIAQDADATRRISQQHQMQQQQNYENNSQNNLSCTVSTENNSSKSYKFTYIAAKAIESNKHPKFMRTIEEHSSMTTNQGPTYNTMLSASLGNQRQGGATLATSISQAQLDTKSKQKVQTVVNSNQASIKRVSGNSQTLSNSASVSHFKSPSTQINSKKQLQGRYLNM